MIDGDSDTECPDSDSDESTVLIVQQSTAAVKNPLGKTSTATSLITQVPFGNVESKISNIKCGIIVDTNSQSHTQISSFADLDKH